MADEKQPVNKGGRPKKTANPVPAPQAVAPPANEGEAETRALDEKRSFEMRRARTGEATSILPMGVRVAAPPFIKGRYNVKNASASLLGSAEEVVKESWRSNHRGWHYAWPLASANQTHAYIRSGVYVPVPFAELDATNPLAAVSTSPTGDTLWMQHILVCISPQWWSELVEAPEVESMQRAAINRATVEAELNEQFGAAGFRGEVDAFTDKRSERVY